MTATAMTAPKSPAKKKAKLCKVTGARKAHAKGLLTDAMCRQKTQQDVFNMQLEVLEATLVTQKATTRTQEVLQKEAGVRIEKLQLEIALLKEKEFLGLSGIEL
ncbi:uncharacterized protein LOC135498586 [Lineus longissimus]|uniref:uncharacterized protein LOC135498586 n=1 Tax=Lineus longissimus TaxID=88925 RepID=UPI00315C6806